MKKLIFHALILFLFHVSYYNLVTASNSLPVNAPALDKKVCSGVHIRNDLKSFEQLRGCDIIDGPVTIALVSNQTHPFEPKDYENITFPQLKEITEYLLFFRVQGLSTLSGLFPNLAVIRGRELVSNYALIIYEMMHLQKINLPRLSDILSGSVRIESNPNLCHVSTVNWEAICKHTYTSHFIKDNSARCNNRCPEQCRPWNTKSSSDSSNRLQGDIKELGAENNRSLFCWSGQSCQEFCHSHNGIALPMAPDGGCCSPQCAGGCYEAGRPDRCIACRSVSQGERCVETCDSNSFEHKGKCINEQECIQKVEIIHRNSCGRSSIASASISNLKAIRLKGEKHGRCQALCPAEYEEDPMDKHKCKRCDKGKCKKVCTPPETSKKPFMVTNVNSLKEVAGCNVINGSLEISIKGGRNVLHELEFALQDLEEISGYLKVTRTYSIVTLKFLKSLRAINGSELDRGRYSLIIIDNPNLQELFTFNQSDNDQKQLNILNGKIFVHLNPKLCPHRINNLKSYANVDDWDEQDVSLHTNGDKEACNTQILDVQLKQVTAINAWIKFKNFALQMDDPRSLLYYLINYREASNGSVSMFDGRDGCNSQNDLWITTEEAPDDSKYIQVNKSDEYQEAIIDVKPATRYALYVKTYTILAGSTGAISEIIYFETAPDTPGIPRQITSSATSYESVIVNWLPPSRPNGIIERYFVTVTRSPELEDLQNLDICDSIANREKITKTLTKETPTSSTMTFSANNQSKSNEAPPTCQRSWASDTDPDIQAEVVTFQDKIIDIVYLKQCVSTNSNRTRRSTEHDASDSDSFSQNSLPRKSLQHDKREPLSTFVKPIESSTNRPVSTQSLMFDRNRVKNEANITVSSKKDSRIPFAIHNLEHFSFYTIEVVACHGEFVSNQAKPSKTYKKCGLQAITQVRTHAIPENDKIIQSSIVFYPANDSVSDNIVTWKRPEKPNGMVLAYKVRYWLQNTEHPIESCINISVYNRDGGYILPNLSPGIYLLKVQTVSMYSQQTFWSGEIEFEIPHNYYVSPAVLALLLLFVLILLAVGVASGTFYYQKRKHELLYASVNPDYMEYNPDEWEVDKTNLVIGTQIGTGSFGMVFKGQLITEKGTYNCAIKTVPPTSTSKQRVDFLREASIMKQFDTYHVVKLMGVVSATSPVYVIMEYMENGDLKEFLRSQRDMHQKQNKPLIDGIYLMAAQIADGMAYLASRKFVHRDLAARNCMVGENRVVKIGDFGLTRDIYANDYYRRDTQDRLPVRWMAPESLSDNLYTSASDVWSYGIVVWEMVTFSAYPYRGLSNDEVIQRVIHGFTMPRPENCPNILFDIMERCWKRKDRDRPTFNDIVKDLLPETEGKLYPHCFYRKPKTDGDNTVTNPEETTGGTESYPLLSWPPNRANGLTNGENHINPDTEDKGL